MRPHDMSYVYQYEDVEKGVLSGVPSMRPYIYQYADASMRPHVQQYEDVEKGFVEAFFHVFALAMSV